MNHCRHGTPIGERCPICYKLLEGPVDRLIVGGEGPTPAAGQIWAERGAEHGLLQIEKIQLDSIGDRLADPDTAEWKAPDSPRRGHVILSAITASWCGSFPLSDFPDEFWYWGQADDLSELLREGVAAMRTLTRVRLALTPSGAPFSGPQREEAQDRERLCLTIDVERHPIGHVSTFWVGERSELLGHLIARLAEIGVKVAVDKADGS